MMLATGVPPVLGALSLGFMSNLFGSITHFGSGQAAVYYGAGERRASMPACLLCRGARGGCWVGGCRNAVAAHALAPPYPCPPPGYLKLNEVFSFGAMMAVINFTLWMVVGGAWWKVLGFY